MTMEFVEDSPPPHGAGGKEQGTNKNLRNVLPSSAFPESCNLPTFKSKINKLDLIFLSC